MDGGRTWLGLGLGSGLGLGLGLGSGLGLGLGLGLSLGLDGGRTAGAAIGEGSLHGEAARTRYGRWTDGERRALWEGKYLRGVHAVGAIGDADNGGEWEEVREGEVAGGGLSKARVRVRGPRRGLGLGVQGEG